MKAICITEKVSISEEINQLPKRKNADDILKKHKELLEKVSFIYNKVQERNSYQRQDRSFKYQVHEDVPQKPNLKWRKRL